MRKIIEYTLISLDGVFSDPVGTGFMRFRDDAYMRDGLGLLTQSEAMVMGRVFYDSAAGIWPVRTEHPWAARLNEIKKYVVSSTLGSGDLLWRDGLQVELQLVSAKTFQKIVKLTYEPRYK